MHEKLEDADFRTRIEFLGETLGLFFLEDPARGNGRLAFEAMHTINPEEAGAAWPFVADDEATRLISQMRDALEEGIDAEGLVWEYRRLFIGPGKKPAPPWGSVYTDRECVVFGESTLALRQWMRETGIRRMVDEKTPEDHIGLTLELLAYLVQNNPEEVEPYLANHLLTWSSHFLEELSVAAEHPFYAALADLTRASLEGLQEELEISVIYPRYYR